MKKLILNRLLVTRRKVSRDWSIYRTKKKHILGLKRLPLDLKKGLITEAREETYQKISGEYSVYRKQKFGLIHKSEYPNFSFTNKIVGKRSGIEQRIFKARRNYDTDDLNRIIPKILSQNRVTGVILAFSIEDENGNIQIVSDYITSMVLNRFEKGETIYEHCLKKFRSGNTKVKKLRFIYIRIVYEKSKSSKRKN